MYRRAALIATGVTLPLIVIGAFVIAAINGDSSPSSSASKGPLPALSFAAAPLTDQQTALCAKVEEALPVSLTGLSPRIVHAEFAVAWGDPAIVVRCGVARPKDLKPGSGAQFVLGGNESGPYYDVQSNGKANIFTTVDRAVYISLTIPAKYQGADELPALSKAIASALPAVCDGDGEDSQAPINDLCTRRK